MPDETDDLEAQLLHDLETIKRFKELKQRTASAVNHRTANPEVSSSKEVHADVVAKRRSPKRSTRSNSSNGAKKKVLAAIAEVKGDTFDSRVISEISGLDVKSVLGVFRRLPECGPEYIETRGAGRRPTRYSKSPGLLANYRNGSAHPPKDLSGVNRTEKGAVT